MFMRLYRGSNDTNCGLVVVYYLLQAAGETFGPKGDGCSLLVDKLGNTTRNDTAVYVETSRPRTGQGRAPIPKA